MLASSRLDLNINQNRNNETRNDENFEDGDFPALKSAYDRRAPTHHSLFFSLVNQKFLPIDLNSLVLCE